MNAKIGCDLEFSAIIVNDDKIYPNNFKLSLNLITATEDNYQQNVAYQRIMFLIEEIVNNSIIVTTENPILEDITDIFNNNHFMILPDEPYDQVLGYILFNKISAIMEERLIIDNLIISSNLNNIKYTIDEFNEFEEDEELIEHWWDRSDISCSDDPNEIECNISWEDIDMEWEEPTDEEEPTEIVFNPEKKTASISILEGGKSLKKKPTKEDE
jgi:hypothetical protein